MTSRDVVKASFIAFFIALFSVAYFGIATTFITVLFSYFALNTFSWFALTVLRSKDRSTFAITLFVIVVCTIFYAFAMSINRTLLELPDIAANAIPNIIELGKSFGITMPFRDLPSLKAVTVEAIRHEVDAVAKFAELATKEFLFLVIGLVVAMSIFLNGKLDIDEGRHPVANNLYSGMCRELSKRFANFYKSFEIVMGAQIIISTINTTFTAMFIWGVDLPHSRIIIPITFICGLLPVIGNLISNSVIVGVAILISQRLAVFSLIFLVVLHKLEYFLNSKIIGGRIKNPMWLTLLGLIVGERVAGIPGMILAPVILHYIKLEGGRIEIKDKDPVLPAAG